MDGVKCEAYDYAGNRCARAATRRVRYPARSVNLCASHAHHAWVAGREAGMVVLALVLSACGADTFTLPDLRDAGGELAEDATGDASDAGEVGDVARESAPADAATPEGEASCIKALEQCACTCAGCCSGQCSYDTYTGCHCK